MSRGAPADARAQPSVLLLTGIGLTAAVGLRAIAPLESHFRVLSGPLGAPGAGGTGEAPAPTTAEDAVATLDRAGVKQAHVVGLSFGAAIAQEVAIRHPERVRSLVLGSSTAGGRLYVAPERPIRQFLRRLGELPTEEGLWASVPYLYAETTSRQRAPLIGEDIARRLSRALDPRSYRAQHAIARAHDTTARLDQITAPTLVIHGEHDRILPLDNGRQLAAGITGARFIALRSGAHAFPTDAPDAGRELVSFLLAQARPARTRNARAGRA